MSRLISPLGQGWEAGETVASAISGWEHSTGYTLPADYRAFLVNYNGGRPYPNMFRHTALFPEEGSPNPTEPADSDDRAQVFQSDGAHHSDLIARTLVGDHYV